MYLLVWLFEYLRSIFILKTRLPFRMRLYFVQVPKKMAFFPLFRPLFRVLFPVIGDGLRAAHDGHVPPGARDGYVEPARLCQEADLAARVRPHQRQHHRFLLAALEAVHAADLQPGVLRGQLQANQLHLEEERGEGGKRYLLNV